MTRRALLAALLAASAAPAAGISYVMQRFEDAACTTLTAGWMQQSWKTVDGVSNCFDLTQGILCDRPCVVKLSCAYLSGSGIVFGEVLDRTSMPDKTCMREPEAPNPMASHLTWNEAKNFFNGECTPWGSTYMKFVSSVSSSDFPDCSVQGDVDDEDDSGGRGNYVDNYVMQFHSDENCQEVFVPTLTDTQPTSTFNWQVHRGAEYCYDMVDETPRSNETSRVADYNMLNFRISCGNTDGIGNGIMMEQYTGVKCSGRSTSKTTWADTPGFYPMNFPFVQDLFNGECIRWGQFSVKFDKPWDRSHYPDCADFACSKGYCRGGRVREEPASTTIPAIRVAASGSLSSSARAPPTLFAIAVALATALVAVDPGREEIAARGLH